MVKTIVRVTGRKRPLGRIQYTVHFSDGTAAAVADGDLALDVMDPDMRHRPVNIIFRAGRVSEIREISAPPVIPARQDIDCPGCREADRYKQADPVYHQRPLPQ